MYGKNQVEGSDEVVTCEGMGKRNQVDRKCTQTYVSAEKNTSH